MHSSPAPHCEAEVHGQGPLLPPHAVQTPALHAWPTAQLAKPVQLVTGPASALPSPVAASPPSAEPSLDASRCVPPS